MRARISRYRRSGFILGGHKCFAILCFLLIPLTTICQINEQFARYKNWERYNEISRFYKLADFQLVWVNNKNAIHDVLDIISSADSFGLDRSDYQSEFIDAFESQGLKTLVDSLDVDVHISDAAIRFFTDLKFGNRDHIVFDYAGLDYNPSANNDIPVQLLASLRSGSLKELPQRLEPKSVEYSAMMRQLNWYRGIINQHRPEARVVSTAVNETNKALLVRFYQLGITDSVLKTTNRKLISSRVKEVQSLFDLLNDGLLRSTTLKALNIPLKQRVEQIKIALNYVRWIEQIKETSEVLVLNIPSARFIVYDHGEIVLDSKVIVGKPSTLTPTLTSTITHVVLYPFWNVPYSIATKELLPSIKADRAFLESGNYQVLNSEGIVLDPYTINWHRLGTRYFPYHIRQSTGCDNALGIVKFEFYNPFSVYLHDTPNKGLFSFDKRYFSHGCMRVEKPIELAHLLLGLQSIAIDTLTAKGCLNQQAPKTVAVERQMPVIVLYSTAWYDKGGRLKFYDDVYGKLKH